MGFFRAFGDMFQRRPEEHHEELQVDSRDWREGIVTLTLSQLRDILKIMIDEVKSDSEKRSDVSKILREARDSGTKIMKNILREAIDVETKEAGS